MMQDKKTLPISFGLLLFGLVCLFNPTVQLLDVVPDTVGYICILLSLRKLRDAIPEFDAACRAFTRMAVLSLCRIPAMLLMTGIQSANTGERSATALFMLIFLILEWIFGIPAFRDLFAAFFHLSERYGIRAAGVVTKKSGETSADALPTLTYIFFVLRGVLSIIPECLYLVVTDNIESDGAFFPLARYYPAVFGVCMALGVVAGILWLTSVFPYVRGIARDPATETLQNEIEKTQPSAYMRKKARFRRETTALYMIVAGILFSVDFAVDGRDVLPDFIAATLFAFAMLLLSRRGLPLVRCAGLAAPVYGCITVFEYIVSVDFHTQYDVSDLGRVKAADKLYRLCEISGVVKAFAAIVTVILIVTALYAYFRSVLSEKNADGALSYSDTANLSEIKAGLSRVAVFGCIEAILSASDVFISRVTETLAVDEDVIGTPVVVVAKYGWFWMLAFMAGLLFLAIGYFTVSDLIARIRRAEELDEE